jgi:hypothetical protein
VSQGKRAFSRGFSEFWGEKIDRFKWIIENHAEAYRSFITEAHDPVKGVEVKNIAVMRLIFEFLGGSWRSGFLRSEIRMIMAFPWVRQGLFHGGWCFTDFFGSLSAVGPWAVACK